jgi:hypothetical protein
MRPSQRLRAEVLAQYDDLVEGSMGLTKHNNDEQEGINILDSIFRFNCLFLNIEVAITKEQKST